MELISKAGPLTVYRTHPLNWSAVWGGWVVATGMAWLLYVLGLAVGYSGVDASLADTAAKPWGAGMRTWLVLTWAVSLFMGSLFTSWIEGKAQPTFGLLNGIAVWGLTTTIGAILLTLGFANILQGGVSLLHANPAGIHSPMATAALWALFFSSIAGAFAAAAGGWIGAGHLHRVYDDPAI